MSASDSDLDPDEDMPVEIDGRLSAIMPRKLFQDDAAVKSGLLQVFVRMKPVTDATETCMQLDQKQLLKATWRNKEAVYKFSQVFQQDAGQADVYEGTTAALVDDLLQQRQASAVVMAYGVTNAGKTFTMQGSQDKPGLVPQALSHIFKYCTGGMQVSLSVMEIYNECINDLLAPAHARLAKPVSLRLKEDKAGHINVQGLSEVTVSSMKEAQELLRRAAKARQSSGTNANERSSRSHAVITVKVHPAAAATRAGALVTPAAAAPATGGLLTHLQQRHAQQQRQRQSQLCFVDLAGCERVKRTGNSGARLRESVAINSSLMTLARCLEVLRYNQQHPGDQKVIPYRESKVTHLFKDVLHGNGRFVMVVNVSPAAEEFNETKRVLQYAALASKVTMTSEVEHDILVGPDGAWRGHGGAAAAGGGAAGGAQGAQESGEAVAAAEAAAAAARSALSCAQARIEELLDDKADLEYEVDVVEKKVELLREELIKAELEKEQLEGEIRAEVAAEMQEMLDAAAAKHKAAADAASQEVAAAVQEAADLQGQVHQLQQQLQAAANQAAAGAHQLAAMLPSDKHQQLLKSAKAAAAAEAQQQAQAEHVAEMAVLKQQYEQEVGRLQQELSGLQQQLAAACQSQQQQQTEAAATAAVAVEQTAQLQAVAAEAVQLLQAQLLRQQQEETEQISAEVGQLQQVVQQLRTFEQQQQQQQQGASIPGLEPAKAGQSPAGASMPVELSAAAVPAPETRQQQQQELLAQPARPGRSGKRATMAPRAAAANPAGGSRRRRQTMAATAAVAVAAGGGGSEAVQEVPPAAATEPAAAVHQAAEPADAAGTVQGVCTHQAPMAASQLLPVVEEEEEEAAAMDDDGGETAAAAEAAAAAGSTKADAGAAAVQTEQASKARGHKPSSRKRRADHQEQQQQQQQQQDEEPPQPQQQQQQHSGSRRKCVRIETAEADGKGVHDSKPDTAAAAAQGEAAAAAAGEAGAEAPTGGAVSAAPAAAPAQKRQRRKTIAAAAKHNAAAAAQEQQQPAVPQQEPEQLQHAAVGAAARLKQQRKRRGGGAAAAAAASALPTLQEEGPDHAEGGCEQEQQQQQQEEQQEQWRSAELVLRDVTSQQQLRSAAALGRRATIATMTGAAAAAAGDDGSDVDVTSMGTARAPQGPRGVGNARAWRAQGGGKGAAAAAGVSQKELQRLGGGVTPVAFRTRHRGR